MKGILKGQGKARFNVIRSDRVENIEKYNLLKLWNTLYSTSNFCCSSGLPNNS